MGQPGKRVNEADQKPGAEDYDYTEAIEASEELAERVRHGDVSALPGLIEAVTGVKVTSSRKVDPSR